MNHGRQCLLGGIVMMLAMLHVAQAQEAPSRPAVREVHILHADSLVGGMMQGERVRRLEGNVRLRQDSTFLQAHRVLQYLDRDDISFFGNVSIIDQGDTLRADTVHYNRVSKVGRAGGRVELFDGEVLVMAPSGIYYVDEKRSQFMQGVTLLDSTSTLTSEVGTYWTEEERALFVGDVSLFQERTVLEADTVNYYRATRISEAFGRVYMDQQNRDNLADPPSRTLLFGDYAYNEEETNRSRVEGQALLLQVQADSTGAWADTLVVQAHRLWASDTDSLQQLQAVGAVQIWKSAYAAVADSVIYHHVPSTDSTDARDILSLFQEPVAWLEEAQLSGDSIRVWARNESLDSVFVKARAFVVQRDTLTSRLQQLKGQTLHGLFEGDSVQTFRVGPTAEAIYYLKDEADQPDGGVRLSGDALLFVVKNDAPQRMEVTGDPQGTYYDETQLPASFQLEGMRWKPEERPAKEDLLTHPIFQHRMTEYKENQHTSAQVPTSQE